MGQRGPQPKPANLRLIEGNKGKRPIDLDGVNPEVEIPDIPRQLGRAAKKEWKRIAPELAKLRLISKIDRTALALYCQAAGRWLELEEAFEAKVLTVMERSKCDYAQAVEVVSTSLTPNGFAQQSVLVQLIGKYKEQAHKYLQSFGLSPSARGRIQPSKNDGQMNLLPDEDSWGTF